MSEQYDPLAEASRMFQRTHIQKNGETAQQTWDRACGPEYPKFQQFGVPPTEVKRLLALMGENQIRFGKVSVIKAQIDAGTYEDDHKLDIAADRLLDDLSK